MALSWCLSARECQLRQAATRYLKQEPSTTSLILSLCAIPVRQMAVATVTRVHIGPVPGKSFVHSSNEVIRLSGLPSSSILSLSSRFKLSSISRFSGSHQNYDIGNLLNFKRSRLLVHKLEVSAEAADTNDAILDGATDSTIALGQISWTFFFAAGVCEACHWGSSAPEPSLGMHRMQGSSPDSSHSPCSNACLPLRQATPSPSRCGGRCQETWILFALWTEVDPRETGSTFHDDSHGLSLGSSPLEFENPLARDRPFRSLLHVMTADHVMVSTPSWGNITMLLSGV